MLDTYCYSGGFSINAALGGALSVTAVDSSQPAVTAAIRNLELNRYQLEPQTVKFVKADALEFMQRAAADGTLFDLVICDPPKLAPSRSTLDRAKGKYVKINSAALRLVRPGGLLLTCSCSAAVTQSTGLLRKLVAEAAQRAGRDVTVLSSSNAALDHPVHTAYPEGNYLTALLCHVR